MSGGRLPGQSAMRRAAERMDKYSTSSFLCLLIHIISLTPDFLFSSNSRLVAMGYIPPLCGMLTWGDAKVITVAMEAIENILIAGTRQAVNNNGINPYARIVEECGGIDKLETLQRHDNQSIYRRAVGLLKEYFDAVDEVQDEEYTDSAPSDPGNPPPPPPPAAGAAPPGQSFGFAPPSSGSTFHF